MSYDENEYLYLIKLALGLSNSHSMLVARKPCNEHIGNALETV